jgi:hypothetical protein
MLDDFTLAEDGQADPLDLGLPPTQSMRPQQQAQKADRSGLLKLAALIPLAMKAGPGAMQGLLSGWQQAQQQRQQQGAAQGRYDQQSAERQAQLESTEKYRTAQLDAQRRTQQQAFLKQFVDQVGTLDDPAAVKALVDMYGGQATALGLDRPTLESYASQTATPDRMLTKKIQKRWNGLSAEEKKIAQSSGASLSIDGQLIEFDKWAPVIGGVVDPKTGAYPQAPVKPENAPAVGSFEDYVLRRFGANPTAQQIEQGRKSYNQSDDRPQPGATILINTVDEQGNPIQRVVPKTPGSTFAVAPSATERTALAEQEAGLQHIADIERIYRPEYVGPVAGRTAKAKAAIPGVDVSEDVAAFHASVAALRNEVIKLMSGAAVSGNEMARMQQQLPDVTDKPSVFQAKLAQTKRNRDVLVQKMAARSGAKPAQPTQTGPTRIGRFEVTVK